MAASIHELHAERFHYGWDNSLAPALTVASGEEVLLHARDASDEQLGPSSTVEDVATLDFDHVNPVSGPVFVEGAAPGDVLAVEILELSQPTWGWTAIIPGFGLLADEFPEPWLRISTVDGDRIRFSDDVTLPLRPFPGTLGVALPEPGVHPGGDLQGVADQVTMRKLGELHSAGRAAGWLEHGNRIGRRLDGRRTRRGVVHQLLQFNLMR